MSIFLCPYPLHKLHEAEDGGGERQREEKEHSECTCAPFAPISTTGQDPAVWILTPDVLLGTANWAKRAVENSLGTH